MRVLFPLSVESLQLMAEAVRVLPDNTFSTRHEWRLIADSQNDRHILTHSDQYKSLFIQIIISIHRERATCSVVVDVDGERPSREFCDVVMDIQELRHEVTRIRSIIYPDRNDIVISPQGDPVLRN